MDRTRPSVDTRTHLRAALDRLARGVARRFEIDRRALAAFRIAVGTLLLADLGLRSRDLAAFYTDAGVLPREALFSTYGNVYSLHAISGEAWVQSLLFVLAGAFALAMTVGYRTRVATVASWLLLSSLQLRNPLVLNSGDALLRMLVFWGIFLPLDDHWAVGAERSDCDRSPAVSIATVALLCQVVLMYATNAVHKTRSDAWTSGEALVYVFTADQFTILLGDLIGNLLGELRALLEAFTILWVALLLAAPLLIVLTGKARTALATVFVGMHLGMVVTLDIGLFPLVVVAGLLPFYPPVVWEAVESLVARPRVADALRPRLRRIARPAKTLDRPERVKLSGRLGSPQLLARIRAGCVRGLPYVCFALVLTSNAVAVDYAEVPDVADPAVEAADQNWQMFAPNPVRTTRWFAAPGVLADGSEVDVLHGSQVELDRPPNVADTYPTFRWRKYLSNVRSTDDGEYRAALGSYLCDRWNREHETRIVEVTIYALHERTDPYDGSTSAGKTKLGEYECSGGPSRSDG